jgi:OOP family OmpA-OmpF porin
LFNFATQKNYTIKICLTLKKKIMNYSTLKKGLAVSFVALMGATSIASAQDSTMTSSSAKVFGGSGQYRTWSLGVNGGVLSPFIIAGGSNDFTNWKPELGYGISLRKQLSHAFGLEGNLFRGKVSGDNEDANASGSVNGIKNFETEIGYAVDLRGVVNIGSVDFLHRENAMNFFVTAGYGAVVYNPKLNGVDKKGTWGDDGDKDYIKEQYIPVGAGVKFKVSDRVSFNLGYTMHFVDADNFDGLYAKGTSKDKFSYGYAGLEFSLGSKSKPNLDWVNPLALMYDELKDPSLRQEVEALKNRVANVEKSIEDLKKDSDGDGVSDQFDKCPGTPAGTAVDGSGCPLPKAPEPTTAVGTATGFETIQFEFNSSVLKTEAYPTLDKLSSVLRENGGKVTVNGYASSEGTAAYNLKLSKDRANSVKTYLVNTGVNASQVATKGNGEANPIASNDTEEGRIQNRRVETARN